jgi:hypothetical protein
VLPVQVAGVGGTGAMSNKLTAVEQIEQELEHAAELKDFKQYQRDVMVFNWCPRCPYFNSCYDWEGGYPGPYCLEPGCFEMEE